MASEEEPDAIETRLVLEAIHARYGYDFRGYAPESIRRRLQAALSRTGLPHLGELQHRLLVEPAFFGSLLPDLTVQVTKMFRDPAFYRRFREQVVPVLRTYPQLKVWNAGCATGEEVYTLAILLTEEDLYDRTQIYATDVSARAVEAAREGVYAGPQLAEFERSYAEAGGKASFDDYCTAGYGAFVMRGNLRRNVVFFQHDLVSDHALGQMNVIFCRNVLIYFDGPLRHRVIEMFADGLVRGGFLCLGDSERIPETLSGAFADFAPSARIYRRGGEREEVSRA